MPGRRNGKARGNPRHAIYALAALAEIAGCFAFWAWARLAKSALWLLPGIVALVAFAYLLTRIDALYAGRAFAAYGGVYIGASLLWLWAVEGARPDRWDAIGAAFCLDRRGDRSIGAARRVRLCAGAAGLWARASPAAARALCRSTGNKPMRRGWRAAKLTSSPGVNTTLMKKSASPRSNRTSGTIPTRHPLTSM